MSYAYGKTDVNATGSAMRHNAFMVNFGFKIQNGCDLPRRKVVLLGIYDRCQSSSGHLIPFYTRTVVGGSFGAGSLDEAGSLCFLGGSRRTKYRYIDKYGNTDLRVNFMDMT
jgi:hypothetical protein